MCCGSLQVDQLMQKLDEQLQLLRQATPLLRQRAEQLTDKEAAAVRRQLAVVLDQQTDFFESNMQVTPAASKDSACVCSLGACLLSFCAWSKVSGWARAIVVRGLFLCHQCGLLHSLPEANIFHLLSITSRCAGSAGESAAHAVAGGRADLPGHRLAAKRGGAGRADAIAGPSRAGSGREGGSAAGPSSRILLAARP